MKQRALSLLTPKPLALALVLAFPHAYALPVVQASGSFVDGSDYLSDAKSGSFDRAPTDQAFVASAVGAKNRGFDSSTTVTASSDGQGHFSTAILNEKAFGSAAPMQAQTHLVFTDSIVNNTGSTQAATFGLNINRVQFTLDNGLFDGVNRASFMASVYVGASTTALWSSGFTIDNPIGSGNTIGSSTTGVDIGLAGNLASACTFGGYGCGTFGHVVFSSGHYVTTLALGNVADGETLNVRYVVDLATETSTYGGVASVSFDDPAGLSIGNGASLAFAPAAPVPEPETAALLAAGLGLVAGAARRQRRARRAA